MKKKVYIWLRKSKDACKDSNLKQFQSLFQNFFLTNTSNEASAQILLILRLSLLESGVDKKSFHEAEKIPIACLRLITINVKINETKRGGIEKSFDWRDYKFRHSLKRYNMLLWHIYMCFASSFLKATLEPSFFISIRVVKRPKRIAFSCLATSACFIFRSSHQSST